MKKLAFGFALLVAGLITFGAATPAQAQTIDFGISIGTGHGGVSVHVGHRHYPGCGHYYQSPAPIRVLVYETVYVRVWDSWNHRWVYRQRVVERWVTAYWSNYYGCYGYTDSQGYFRCVR
ncbi:MAG TPA: hypothetical protein V6D08_05450 [Candidatus Obscuribacterales bacterium]